MAGLRFYFDEDSEDGSWIQTLKRNAFDVSSALLAGRLAFADPEQLRFATEQGRVLVSHNVRDYMRIHTQLLRAGAHHAGILLVAQTDRYSPGAFLERVVSMDRRYSAEEMVDTVTFLSKFGPEE